MKCRACGHDNPHKQSNQDYPEVFYCDGTQPGQEDWEDQICCQCSNETRQIAALRAGFSAVYALLLSAADPCEVYDRIDAALAEAGPS